ncbi:MAG: MurR/RpiR family transcriptional regulator [Clostridia bacterium]|nr:MurR/RpiR family transcriptional regulator [Clostridia bacterium]
MPDSKKSILCLSRISMNYGGLSVAEKKVADYVLGNWKEVAGQAVAEIAREADVSQATVVRFCRSLGFAGVAEFRLYLRSERLSSDADYLNISKSDSELVVARKVTKFNKDAIDDTMAFLDGAALKDAADALNDARHVIIMAEGGSGSTARCIYDSFLQIGIPCVLETDSVFQMYTALRVKPGDVIVAVCHSGRTKNVIDAMKIAKEAGAKTISILGMVNTPLEEYSDILLYTGLSNHPFYSEMIAARICELNVVAALHAILTFRNKDKLELNNQRISEVLEMKRI